MAETRSRGGSAGHSAPIREAGEALGAVTLALGPEELLAERVLASVVRAARDADPDADLIELEAAELDAGAVAELTSPSLFATCRAVVVRGLESASSAAGEALAAYAARPQPDIAVGLHHRGGQKGKATLDRLRKAGAGVVACDSLKSYELAPFVAREVRAGGGRIDEQAAGRLVEAVGSDLRALTAAVAQLLADTGTEPLTDQIISRYFAGRAEVTSFAVADAAVAGRTAHALEQLRWALRAGVPPVLVTSALASGLRGLGRLAGAPRGQRDADLARVVGVPPWKLKVLRGQLRGWTPEGLGRAIRIAARADADVKGAADDPAYAMEKAILGIGRAREGA